MLNSRRAVFNRSIIALAALALAGCASADVTPLAQDTVLISADAAPACGGRGARKVAFQQAAAETLRRGYDKFIVVSSGSSNTVGLVGTTSVYGTTTVHSTATSHGQQFAIKMFRYSDAAADNAIDARAELGPEWEKKIREKALTCF